MGTAAPCARLNGYRRSGVAVEGGDDMVDTPNPVETLKKAKIFEVDPDTRRPKAGVVVTCMFNPYEYTVSKSNQFSEPNAANSRNQPDAEFSKASPQRLKLNLVFDTYEAGKDVRSETDKLWELMKVKPRPGRGKESPPAVAFHWGSFYFVAYITSMTQKFTLFDKDGVPVRAHVDVEFTQYVDVEDNPPQNPTSGGGEVERAWQIIGADRLDNIAADVYGDATRWRQIAQFNGIVNPLALQPGQSLLIPFNSQQKGTRPS